MPSTEPDLSTAVWRRSSYSNSSGGECVEVRDDLPGVVPVRDSKVPHGPALLIPAPAWAPFVDWAGTAQPRCLPARTV